MLKRKLLATVVSILYTTSSAIAGNVQYTNPNSEDSPGYGLSKKPTTVDTSELQNYRNTVNNSGLFKNKIGESTSPTSADVDSTLPDAPKTYYTKEGLEVDIESGLTTGKVLEPGSQQPAPATTTASGATAVSSGAAKSSSSLPIVTSIDAIAALVVASQGQATLTVPGLPEMQSGKSAYASSRPTCNEEQETAETFCREKTNPGLQTAAVTINGLVSGMNAINDSCKTSSKVMSVASLALTAYTVTCGALRVKCEKTCVTTKKGLLSIQAGIAKPATCVPIDPLNGVVCSGVIAKYNAEIVKIKQGLSIELNEEEATTVAGRTKLCTHEYVGLLASAGVGIFSVIKTLKETSDCDKNTRTDASSTQELATATTTTENTSASATTQSEVASPSTTTTPTKVGLRPVHKEQERGTASTETAKAPVVAADSPYRAYLPGGEKDPLKGQSLSGSADASTANREITSAHGKNNFEKIREKFRSQGDKLISP